MRVAVIDIGTNSTRLLIADVADGQVTELERRTTVTRLGQGVDHSGELQPEAIDRVHAALDVTDPEPLPADHPLLQAPNTIVLPHVGSATRHTRARMTAVAVDNALAGLDGRPLPQAVPAPRG